MARLHVVPLGDEAQATSLKLSETLRAKGLRVEMGYSGNMQKRMKRADKMGASYALILGSNEIERGVVQVKNLKTGEQTEMPIATAPQFIHDELLT